jgi:hypothetical protein
MYIGLHVKYPLFLSDLNSLDSFSKNPQISNFMKIRPVGAELFHADIRTDIQDEANSRFWQFCERALKKGSFLSPKPLLRVIAIKLKGQRFSALALMSAL